MKAKLCKKTYINEFGETETFVFSSVDPRVIYVGFIKARPCIQPNSLSYTTREGREINKPSAYAIKYRPLCISLDLYGRLYSDDFRDNKKVHQGVYSYQFEQVEIIDSSRIASIYSADCDSIYIKLYE